MTLRNRIVLSLISHTNIGKTTLTRTLLKRDVGEVRDAPHVTDESEDYVLIQTEEDELIIWDTPGFGNVAQLLKRVSQEGGALGWIMHEVVDRAFNRALYSSMEAARNVRSESDIVLYMVNVREEPEDAGYVRGELQLLQALGKPVIMVLNQLDPDRLQRRETMEQKWLVTYNDFTVLKKVITLDAFTRSWRQELRLMDEVNDLLEPGKREVLARLRARFVLINRNLAKECAEEAAKVLWFAAHQTRETSDDANPKALFELLLTELQARLDAYLDKLIQKHGIQAEGQALLKADIQQVTGLVGAPIPEKRSGLLAGAVTGASSGLLADMLSGGLTFGGGALLGFLGGYLGGLSYARVLNLSNRKGLVSWQKDTLVHIFKLLMSYYLLAALHGRGKGVLMVDEPAPFLSKALDAIWSDYQLQIIALVEKATKIEGSQPGHDWLSESISIFNKTAERVFDKVFEN